MEEVLRQRLQDYREYLEVEKDVSFLDNYSRENFLEAVYHLEPMLSFEDVRRLIELPVHLTEDFSSPYINGTYVFDKINIRASLVQSYPNYAVKALLHEWAHHLHQHTHADQYFRGVPRLETEAELTSMLVGEYYKIQNDIGLDYLKWQWGQHARQLSLIWNDLTAKIVPVADLMIQTLEIDRMSRKEAAA